MHGRIVVAVDGSEASLKGVQVAIDLARSARTLISLVTVEPPIFLPPTVYPDAIARLEEAQKAHARDVLHRASRLVTDAGLMCDTVQLTGSPAEAIADYVKGEGIWGVVVGAVGHNALARVMLGSVADRLVHLCTRPVLVVR